MILTVKPANKLKGSVHLPPSKSYSIRSFIIAACGGKSVIVNPSHSDDCVIARRVAGNFGSKVTKSSKNTWRVAAFSKRFNLSRVGVRESGTTLRFVLPLIGLYANKSIVQGEGTLKGRPNHFLTRTLRKMGVNIKGKGKQESIPITFSGGKLKGGKVEIDGSISSQFISALLIACPQLKEKTTLILKGKKLVSTDYITMTLQVLKDVGIKVKKEGLRTYRISGNQKFKGLKKFTVPSDYGLAAFLMAAAAITDSNVTLKGSFQDKYVQADGHIIPLLRKMGVRLTKTSNAIKIKGPFNLKGGVFSLKDCPDLLPIMTVLALFAKGRTKFTNIKHARVKESDRISDLREELLKIGAKITEKQDEMIIYPKDNYKEGRLLNPHKDHRLAMSFAVLGLKVGVRVKDMECCSKSYPDFVRDFRALGVRARSLRAS